MKRRRPSLLAVIALSLVATVIQAVLIRESAALGSPGLSDATRTLESLPLNNTSSEMFTWEIIDLHHALMAAIDPFFTRSSDIDWRLSREQNAAAAKISVAGVSITGPTSGQIGDRLTFAAIVTPLDASPPVRYTWSPAPIDGQRRQIATFSWTTPGWKVINVTAYNKTGSASDSHRVFISGPITPVQEVDIINPESVFLNETDALIATFSPNNATWPLDFLWWPAPDSGQHTPHVTYTWRSMGDISITVIASNTEYSPPVSHTHYLTVRSMGLSDVWISGTRTVTANQPALFTAVVSPARATRPITYNWSPVPDNGQSAPVATYVFTRSGDVAITVIAENIGGSKQSPPHNVHVDDGVRWVSVYLPLALRRWPPLPGIPYLFPISSGNDVHTSIVTWGSAELADGYVVQEDIDDGFSFPVEVCNVAGNSCLDPGNVAGLHYYHVAAYNSWGIGGWSNSQSINILWELEPNGYIYQSNGPLGSGVKYYGYPNDEWDTYYFRMNSPGLIIVDLANSVGQGTQLLLYYESYSDLVCRVYEPPYYLECTGPAGQYYVSVFTASGHSNSAPYALTVTFPQN